MAKTGKRRIHSLYSRPIPSPGALNFFTNLTKREFLAECDINTIIRRYENREAPSPWQSPPVAQFGDFANAPDFHSAQEFILDAERRFMTLPARVRTRFQNDPGQLLAFLQVEANRGEAEELGLINKKPTPSASPSVPSTP